MKMNKLMFFLVGLAFLFGVEKVWAVDLVLTRVGETVVVGTPSTAYSVVGAIPQIAGTATPSSYVSISVNAIPASVSAAVSGVWVFTPTNLVSGINTVSIANNAGLISFYLSYTPATVSATPTTMPEVTEGDLLGAGSWEKPFMFVALGLLVLIVGEKVKERIEDKWNI